ncbi:hypothetical protein ASPFODRAFT_204660 [Aspergillus luchuensis CBS 106.47]|uniref:Uncharacterized protein n=1 Tax=Aspergillus luchuensis (strain CBS 106.47) TaxID=1137211 RepID=A0A1M3TSI7_ASPLC|nr:hypothetical protein ASPFODRAFT_204660 [Aspergillus luchuensis CBS 106.47]
MQKIELKRKSIKYDPSETYWRIVCINMALHLAKRKEAPVDPSRLFVAAAAYYAYYYYYYYNHNYNYQWTTSLVPLAEEEAKEEEEAEESFEITVFDEAHAAETDL